MALEVVLASLTDSTIKQYNTAFKLWWEFNEKREQDPLDINAQNLLVFLSERHTSGTSLRNSKYIQIGDFIVIRG